MDRTGIPLGANARLITDELVAADERDGFEREPEAPAGTPAATPALGGPAWR